MAKKISVKALEKAKIEEHHKFLYTQAKNAMEELLQDRDVPIERTLHDMLELKLLIEWHIQGLEDDIEAQG